MNYEVMGPKERKPLLEGESSFKIPLTFHDRAKTRYQAMHSQFLSYRVWWYSQCSYVSTSILDMVGDSRDDASGALCSDAVRSEAISNYFWRLDHGSSSFESADTSARRSSHSGSLIEGPCFMKRGPSPRFWRNTVIHQILIYAKSFALNISKSGSSIQARLALSMGDIQQGGVAG